MRETASAVEAWWAVRAQSGDYHTEGVSTCNINLKQTLEHFELEKLFPGAAPTHVPGTAAILAGMEQA